MSASGERSAIGRAVEQLKAALLSADVARGHADKAVDISEEVWGGYLTAAGDSEAEMMTRAVGRVVQGRDDVKRGLAALGEANAAVRGYIEAIAPNEAIRLDNREASTLSGEDLLQRRRPRGTRAWTNLAVSEAHTALDGGRAFSSYLGNIQSFERPPQTPSYLLTRPCGPTFQEQRPAIAHGDAVETLTVALIVMVKAAQVAVSRIAKRSGRS